jgi:replicative DNA helicase
MDKNILELKRISRYYDTPVVVISSFNRSSYLNEVSFESFKESGAIEYSSDVIFGLQLRIDRTDYSTKSDDNNKRQKINDERHRVINEAKNKYPREVELVILKNRMYKAWDTIEFKYYTHYDYFKDQE